MNQRLINLFTITTIIPFLLIRKAISIDSHFLACNPKTCGDGQNITFPFYIEREQEKYCGYPGFNVSCRNDRTVLSLQGSDYIIHQISYENQTIRVSNTAAFNACGVPPSRNSSLLPNEKFKLYSNQTQLVLMYHCNSSEIGGGANSELMKYKVNCSGDSNSTLSLFKDDPLLGRASGVCENAIVTDVDVDSKGDTRSTEIERMLERGFLLNWTASICSICQSSGGKCGFNYEMVDFRCFCPDRPHVLHCVQAGYKLLPTSVSIAVGVSSAFATIVIASLGCYYCFARKQGMKPEDKVVEAFILNYHSLMPRRFSYSNIKKMTNSFTYKLGQGGFGSVYRGNLSDGRLVAVKLLLVSIGNGEEFINEVASISRTSHVNVVTLLGFCYERTKRALVYEYMPSGSLDKFIFHQDDEKTCRLEQKTLSEIATGIARGLEYLHRGCNTRIVHFDIKPHNILLDEDLCPKISDFGLAKLCRGKESIVSMFGARGTAGYIAPEVFMRGYGGVSYKSDVYSYGMMILEMFAGKDIVGNDVTHSTSSEVYFPDSVYKYLENMMLDEEEETMRRRMIIVGLWCIQTSPKNRPSMTKVIEMLEGNIELLHIPPKPLLFSSTKPTEFSSSSSIYLNSELDEDEVLPLSEPEFALN